MIIIKKSPLLKNSIPYQYYTSAKQKKLKYFVSIDNGFQGNALLASLDEDNSGVVWAEDDGKVVACVSYHLQKIGKKIFTINFFHADTVEIYTRVNAYVEELAGQHNCYFIEELVTAKDNKRINDLETIGYQKEFTLMFKKV